MQRKKSESFTYTCFSLSAKYRQLVYFRRRNSRLNFILVFLSVYFSRFRFTYGNYGDRIGKNDSRGRRTNPTTENCWNFIDFSFIRPFCSPVKMYLLYQNKNNHERENERNELCILSFQKARVSHKFTPLAGCSGSSWKVLLENATSILRSIIQH